MKDDSWYFAYGSNLSIDQKQLRTARIRQAIRAQLPGFRFAFNKRGTNGEVYANILPEPGQSVWGVIYLCSPAAMRDMDRHEGVSGRHYERLKVQVVTDQRDCVEAVAYVACAEYLCPNGVPSGAYVARIVNGARQHQLPDEYICQLERLSRQSPT
jgi:gamma-glutamylcyclotransferase